MGGSYNLCGALGNDQDRVDDKIGARGGGVEIGVSKNAICDNDGLLEINNENSGREIRRYTRETGHA